MATERQLEIFIAVVDRGGVRQAAEALGISQPSISRQLRALERSVGGQVLVRERGRRARISQLGAMLLPDARQTLEQQRRLRRNLPGYRGTPLILFVRPFLLSQIKSKNASAEEMGLPGSTQFKVMDDNEDIAPLVEEHERSAAIYRTHSLPYSDRITTRVIRSRTASLYCAPQTMARVRERSLQIEDVEIFFPSQIPGLKSFTGRFLKRVGLTRNSISPGPPFVEFLVDQVIREKGAALLFDDTVRQLVAQNDLTKLIDQTEAYYLALSAHRSVSHEEITAIETAFHEF